jgi:hypothetical protein
MFAWLNKKTIPPEPGDVMKRALVLKYLVVKALATPPPEYLAEMMKKWSEQERRKFIHDFQNLYAAQIEQLHRIGLWDEMGQSERDFMQSAPTAATQQALLEITWLAESAVCLLWALGYVAELPPYDQEADPKEMNALPQQTLKLLVENATLLPADTIMKQRNFAELWHWRARTRLLQESGRMPSELPKGLTIGQIIQMTAAKAAEKGAFAAPIGNDFPAFQKPYRELTAEEFSRVTSIAMERHRAFNWLCGYAPGNKWADTPTGT